MRERTEAFVRGGSPADRRALDDGVPAQTHKRVRSPSTYIHVQRKDRASVIAYLLELHPYCASDPLARRCRAPKHRGSMKHANQTIKKKTPTRVPRSRVPCEWSHPNGVSELTSDPPNEDDVPTRSPLLPDGYSSCMLCWLGRYDVCDDPTLSVDTCSEMKRPDRSLLP